MKIKSLKRIAIVRNLGGTVQYNFNNYGPQESLYFFWVFFMPLSIEHLEKEIVLLKDRNIRVEQEKAWENSTQRKMSIIIITYFVMILAF